MKWLYRHYDQRPFRTRHVFQRMKYQIYPMSRNAIYIALHKCWKFRLLSRKRYYGNSYVYRISDWGVRYVEEGYQYRENEVRLKLLRYIVQYGDEREKRWAEQVLAPRLLQRFFRGRRAQYIDLGRDLTKAMMNAADTLQRRIQSEAFEPDEELAIECYNDMNIFYSSFLLLRDLYPNFYTPQNCEMVIRELDKTKQTMRDVIDDIIMYDPPPRIVIHRFNPSGKMRAYIRSKPRAEHRPNAEDHKKLIDLYLKMAELALRLY